MRIALFNHASIVQGIEHQISNLRILVRIQVEVQIKNKKIKKYITMCNFKIGQEVVSLIDSNGTSAQYLKKGEIATITRLSSCEHCGGVLINVNNRSTTEKKSDTVTCFCGNRFKHFGFGWSGQKVFSPLQTDSEEADMTESLEEVFERELFKV